MVKPANAQTTPTSSVPEFTMKIVDHILNFPPTPSIDPFTGKQTIYTKSSVEWTTIDITIVNQKFNVQTEVGANSYTGIMYAIEFKGQFVNDWSQLTTINGEGLAGPNFVQNSGSVTVVSLAINGADIDTISIYAPSSRPDSIVTIPEGGQADFRIKAMIGDAYTNPIFPFDSWHFNGTESDWSDIATITFNKADGTTVIVRPSGQSNNSTPTLNPTPSPAISSTPTVPEFPTWIILPLFAAMILLSAVFIKKTMSKKNVTFLVQP